MRHPDAFGFKKGCTSRLCAPRRVLAFKDMSHTITIRLSEELAAWLEGVAEQSGDSQGRLLREQLVKARTGGEAHGFMRLAGTVDGPRDLSLKKGFTRS